MSLLRDLFGTVGNKHFELGRVLWAVGVVAMIAYQGVAIILNDQPFSAVEFGTGVAAILAAGGFGVAAKDKARSATS